MDGRTSVLRELALGLLDAAEGDLRAAKVLLERGLVAEALYHVEQASEKVTKAALLLVCRLPEAWGTPAGYCGEAASDPDGFLRRVGHDPSRLLKVMARGAVEAYGPLLQRVPEPARSRLLGRLGLPGSPEAFAALLAGEAEAVASSLCSRLQGALGFCELAERIGEVARSCGELKTAEACEAVADPVAEAFRRMSRLLLVRRLWLRLEGLLDSAMKSADELLKRLPHLLEEALEEASTVISESSGVPREVVLQVAQQVRPLLEEISRKLSATLASFSAAFVLFTVTSSLYELLRYPVATGKLEVCRDERLTRLLEEVRELCGKPLLVPHEVVTADSPLAAFSRVALDALGRAVAELRQVFG